MFSCTRSGFDLGLEFTLFKLLWPRTGWAGYFTLGNLSQRALDAEAANAQTVDSAHFLKGTKDVYFLVVHRPGRLPTDKRVPPMMIHAKAS